MGGNATLASYGVPDASAASARPPPATPSPPPSRRSTWRSSTPASSTIRIGGYLFVHAGIRPGVPLAAQTRDDLIWIREPFLTSDADFGFKVVHGHTIVPAVEHQPNRIAVDTGAVRTGVLSCLVLEGDAGGAARARRGPRPGRGLGPRGAEPPRHGWLAPPLRR